MNGLVGAGGRRAGGVLVVGEAHRNVDVDAADRVHRLLEGGEVEAHEVVDGDAQEVAQSGVRHHPAGVGLARRHPTLAIEHAIAVGLIDPALVHPLAGGVDDGHVPVARDGDLGDRGWAGGVGLDGDDHHRVGEVLPVVAGAAVAVERDVDPLLVGDLVGLDGRAALAPDQADDDRGHVGVEGVSEAVQDLVGEAADEQHDHQRGGEDHPAGGHPPGADVVARAPGARCGGHLVVLRSGPARRHGARPTRAGRTGSFSWNVGGDEGTAAKSSPAPPVCGRPRVGRCPPGTRHPAAHRAPNRKWSPECGELMTTPRPPRSDLMKVPESPRGCASADRPRTGLPASSADGHRCGPTMRRS